MRQKIFTRLLSIFLAAMLLGVSGGRSVQASGQLQAAIIDPGRLSFQALNGVVKSPTFITYAGDGSGRLFVAERAGLIRIFKNGTLLSTPFLDIRSLVKSTSGEQGLLSVAFHPAFKTNGLFFVAYTAPRAQDTNGSNLVLEKFSVSGSNADQANPSSGVVVLTIPHPTYGNHNGGTLAFGGDGYLYWSTGDGGDAGDPNNNAQNLGSLLGKILRLNVNTNTYQIPPSNPFYTSTDPAVKKEIWAYGLRNPWRISFDRLTHDLYIADVGQGAREEIDFQPGASTGGQNYGWRVMEGSLCYNPPSGCDKSGKVLPVAEYDHSLGCSVTGGYVYRGQNYPVLAGQYFYADFCSGRLFGLSNVSGRWTAAQLLDTSYQITTFGEDERGELYFADYATGKIYNIQYEELAADSVGVFRPSNGVIFLKNSNSSGIADISINYGLGGDYPVVGDWDGDGKDTIGVYRNGTFLLRNSNTPGFADLSFSFGQAGDQPVAGDWDGDGKDTIGVYRPSTGAFYLRNTNAAGQPDRSFFLGNAGDVAIAGDWNGDGTDTTGVFRPSSGVIYLKNANTTGLADVALNYGLPGDKPVVGDWDNNGTTTIGIYRGSRFYLRDSNTPGFADIILDLGLPGDLPIAGNWDNLP